jgi:hypothetical protein
VGGLHVGFLWFLRISEMTVPAQLGYDPSVHLSPADISFDHASNPTIMFITIKQSKTDPFRNGVTLVLGRTWGPLCPVAGMAAYLKQRGLGRGPLFRFANNQYLTWV